LIYDNLNSSEGNGGMLTLDEMLLLGICALLAVIAAGLRLAIRELREIRTHLAAEKAFRSGHGGT